MNILEIFLNYACPFELLTYKKDVLKQLKRFDYGIVLQHPREM